MPRRKADSEIIVEPDFIDETSESSMYRNILRHFEQDKVSKGARIIEEMQINSLQPQEDIINPDGTVVHKKHLFSIDSYSTRFLSPDNQLLLAIDKIAFPEFKSGIRPFHEYGKHQKRFQNWDGLAFGSIFSLNGGDKTSLMKLIQAFPKGTKEKYIFTLDPDSIYAGTYDETSTFRSLSKDKKSPTAQRLENKMFDLFNYLRLECSLSEISPNHIVFAFETYDERNEDGSGQNQIPLFTTLFTFDCIELKNKYTMQEEWNYAIHVFSNDSTLPDDTSLKLHFETMKVLVRTALATLGIFPEKLLDN